jgi:hypothetical protein
VGHSQGILSRTRGLKPPRYVQTYMHL